MTNAVFIFSDDFDDVCHHEDTCTGISNDDNSGIILNAQTNTSEPKVEIEETLNMIEQIATNPTLEKVGKHFSLWFISPPIKEPRSLK